MKIWKSPDNQAAANNVVVVSLSRINSLKPTLVTTCAAVVIASGLVWWRVSVHYAKANSAENAGIQKALDKDLSVAISASDDQAIIAGATQLIDGANNGRFTVSKDKLGWYYSDRANACIDQKQYANAAQDFEKSADLSSYLKLAALQGEFEARYLNGERKQLLPLLQTLVQMEKQSQNPMRGSSVNQYQEYIQDLQQNKEISF